ncbi:prenyltransferase/squalene oxidase repeat-containing protein [Thermococcus peptonophilus]|uniref:hypothetical protein n=1 Tax=Thermococcus peptonophilus TaxID=53952 RepID=UPI0006D13E09
MEEVETKGMLTQDFYYTALILAKHSSMTPPEERQSLIDFINEYRYSGFAWVGFFAIPQPLQTAMGINLLKALNVSDVDAPANWLLSLTDGGWGLLINYPFTIMSSPPDVPTTLLVLEALSGGVASEDELEPHLDWLLAQRLENGLWGGHYKTSVDLFGQVTTAPPPRLSTPLGRLNCSGNMDMA